VNQDNTPLVFTPSNEPYLGRQSVYHFDQVILSSPEANVEVAAYTHTHELSDLQKAACQLIPQGINLALSIRELVRQGYLFAAVVLIRPLIERSAIISYLHEKPTRRGSSLTERLETERSTESGHDAVNNAWREADIKQAKQICDTFNHIVHGDPIGSNFNLVNLDSGGLRYSVSKVLNNPELCDFICFQSYCYLIVLMARMAACFPEVKRLREQRFTIVFSN
jgi:hypothetical protein